MVLMNWGQIIEFMINPLTDKLENSFFVSWIMIAPTFLQKVLQDLFSSEIWRYFFLY